MDETKDPQAPPAYDDPGQQHQPPYPQQKPYPVQAQQPYPQQPPVTGQPMPQQQQYPQPVPGTTGQWQQQQPGTVVLNMPVRFTPLPMTIQCPNCGNTVTSNTEKVIGPTAWLTTGALCLFFLGCLLCPIGLVGLCVPAFKDTIHTCPTCKFTLGKHAHM